MTKGVKNTIADAGVQRRQPHNNSPMHSRPRYAMGYGMSNDTYFDTIVLGAGGAGMFCAR